MNRRELLEHGPRLIEHYWVPAAVLLNQMLSRSRREPARKLQTVPLQSIAPTPTEARVLSAEEVTILQGAQQLEVTKNNQEELLWFTYGYKPSAQPLPVDANTQKEANDRLYGTLALMNLSVNRPLKEAADYILPFIQRDDASIVIDQLPIDPTTGKKPGATTRFVIFEDVPTTPHIRIIVDQEFTLNKASPINLACVLAHEIKHVQRINEFVKRLKEEEPSLSAHDILIRQEQQKADLDDFLIEEALGYEQEALSYIWAYGLGYYEFPVRSIHRLASTYVQTRMDPRNPEWKNYVKKILEE